MKKIIIPIGVLFLVVELKAQTSPSQTENYVQSRIYIEPVVTTNSDVKQINTVQYLDGLGRPKQVVNVKASPLGRDLVTHIEYDAFGRQVKNYLSVPQGGTMNGAIVSNPLNNAANTPYGTEKIYSERILEKSPLDRVLQQKHVGMAWNDKPMNFNYDAVTITDGVRKFKTVTSWENEATKSVLEENVLYTDGQLYKNTITDEDGNKTIEFKNGRDQLIMVRKVGGGDTYYVYNEYDQLAFVLPPLASMGGDIVSNTVKHNELCYQYRYDRKGRLVEKKIPGKGWESMVYDKTGRLILSQDVNLKELNKWLITKYDQFGRVVYTGLLVGGERITRQNEISNLSIIEKRDIIGFIRNGINVYYTNNYFNGEIPTVLSVNYYDTYPSYNFNPSFPVSIQGEQVLTDNEANGGRSTKGLPVMNLVKNIEDDNWTKNYIYYDTKGRTVGGYYINHLGGYTRTESKLDFVGVPQTIITSHQRLNISTKNVITEKFTYDHQNRLLVHRHQIDNKPEEILVQNTYNELSQLEIKKVGGTDPTAPLQTINYKYNIRGWMTMINNPNNLGENLFAYEIKYNLPSNPSLGKFNGNISEADWKTSDDGILKRYSYQYDSLNRLLKGNYSKPESTITENNYYNEELTYDVNGNIKTLKRFSKPSSGITPIKIDDLIYNYRNNNFSNTLEKITLPAGIVNNPSGYNAAQNIIAYDLNGNMIDHKDKGKSSIKYNFLNLPNDIDGEGYDYTRYTYRADGVKVKREEKIIMMNAYHNETDYLDGFQYDNGSLKFVPTMEGYYDFEKLRYVYNYTDHLGNIRLSYVFNSKMGFQILDNNNYYPFGLPHNRDFGKTSNKSYFYEYNGKEYQNLTGMYDYGARMYMPDLGRWGVVDELAEKFNRHTPYAYVVNDPINGIDPDGRDVIFLAASKDVPLVGHGAVIIGNERDGWYYYSMNGTGEGSSPYGNAKYADVGTFLGTGLSPKQAMLAANTNNPDETHHYNKFVTVKTTKEEDATIKIAAAKAANAETYCVIGQSCATVMLDSLNKIIDIRSNNAWYVPHARDPAPNNIMDYFNMEKVGGINHLNRFYLSTDKEIQVRKVGKLEVGPLIDEKGGKHY